MIAIIISLLLSVSIWIYVTETDQTSAEKEFEDITVTIINETEQFNITADNVSVVLIGTNSQLVDVEASEIVVRIDARQITEAGDYSVTAHDAYVNGATEVKVKNPQSISVNVHVKAEK